MPEQQPVGDGFIENGSAMVAITQSWIEERRRQRLEALLAWSPSENLLDLLVRLYFCDLQGIPVLSRETSLAQLLLMAVAQQLYQLRKWNAAALKQALIDLDDATFVRTFAGEDMACRVTQYMSSAERQEIRQLVARFVLGEPAVNA